MSKNHQTTQNDNNEKSVVNEQSSDDEKTQLVQKLSKLTTGAAVAAVLVDASTNPALASP
jgi:hypothetical protein